MHVKEKLVDIILETQVGSLLRSQEIIVLLNFVPIRSYIEHYFYC